MGRKKGQAGRSRGFSGQPDGRPVERAKTANIPSGQALEVNLLATGPFENAVRPLECPAAREEDKGRDQDSASKRSKLIMDDWSKAEQLLHWFKAGAEEDAFASLSFSKTLGQGARAAIHKCAEKIGLDSFSQGFGEERHVTIYPKGQAPAKAVINDVTQKKAKLLHLLAKAENIRTSRDELTEMLAANSLPQNLQSIWDTKGAEQLSIVRLNKAASRGEVEELQEAIKELPDVVKGGKAEVASNLTPLNCAAAKGYINCMQLLIDAGAPKEAKDGFGLTPLQASRKFEQNDAEAFLLQAGAEDANPHSDFSQDISLHGSADDLPSSQPARPQSAQVGQAKERAGARPSRFNLQQAIHAKPFVPKSLSGQQASGSQESMGNGAASGQDQAHQPDKTQAGVEEAAVARNPAQSVAASSNHTPIRSSFEDVPGLAIRDPEVKKDSTPEGDLPPSHSGYQEGRQPAPAATGKQGSRTLSQGLPEGLRLGSPNLKDDPRIATRGRPGASAVALGRRIMESAHPQLKRHNSVSQHSDNGKEEGQQEPLLSQRSASARHHFDPIKERLNSDKIQMVFSRKQETPWKDNKHRVNAWMESAQEEHSSQNMPSVQSDPNFRLPRTSLDSRPDSAPAETSPEAGSGDEQPDSPRRGQLIGRLSTLKESEEAGLSASQGPSRALSASETSAKQGLEAARSSLPPSASGLAGKTKSGDFSSAAELAKSRAADEKALEEKTLEDSWDKTRKAVEEAAKSPKTPDQLSFTEVSAPAEDAKLSPGKSYADEVGSTVAKGSSPHNGAKTSEAAPQPNPQQSSPASLDSKESPRDKPSSKEAKEETNQPAAPKSTKPSSQKVEAPAEEPTSSASKKETSQEKAEPSSGEPAEETDATAAMTCPQPDAVEPSSHSQEIEAIQKEAEEGDGEEAEEYRHLLGEGVSTEDIAKRNIDKKEADEADAPSKSKESPKASPPRKEPLPPPSIQDPRGAAFPSAPPVASGATAPKEQSGVPITHGSLPQGTQPSNLRPEDSSADLDSEKVQEAAKKGDSSIPNGNASQSQARSPYLEGTQPPGFVESVLHEVPAVVGGRTLSGNLDSSEQTPAGLKEGNAGLHARQATYGQQKGESATGKGKQVISDAEQGRVTPSSSAVAGAPENFRYVEPSQPPGGQQASLSEIPTVVGGKAVSKENAAKKPTSSQTKLPLASSANDPSEPAASDSAKKLPAASGPAESSEPKESASKAGSGKLPPSKSEGNLSNPTSLAEEEGEAITAVRPSQTEDAEAAAKQDMTGLGSGDRKSEPPPLARISEEAPNVGSARGSLGDTAEKERPLDSVPEFSTAPQAPADSVNSGTVHSLLGTSATAAAATATAPQKQRPRGLGNSQGLPTKKRPSSAKATPRNVRSKEDKSAKAGQSKREGKEDRSAKQRAVESDEDAESQSALHTWVEEHKYIIYGAVATGAAAVAALFWATRRR